MVVVDCGVYYCLVFLFGGIVVVVVGWLCVGEGDFRLFC